MSYLWNTDKTGGVALTSKIVQKGVDNFKLMSAGNLDWDNVEVESGVHLNTTDDLLDYIKSSNADVIGRIDEAELANVGYEVRCATSVCYVGDTLTRVPVEIWKTGLNRAMTWSEITTEGIAWNTISSTKPAGGNTLMVFQQGAQWLNGEANKAGTYVFDFTKNGVSIAQHRLIVIIPTYKSAIVTAYVKSTQMPQTPTGGAYNFSTGVLTTPPTSTNPSLTWSASSTGLTGSGPIWFSTGSVSEEDGEISWTAPCILLTEEIIQQDSADHKVKEIAIYKAVKSTASAPSAPSGANAGSYSFSANNGNGSFTCPTGWSLEPNAAVTAYKSSAATADQDNYKIWKSYNSYQCTVTLDTPPVYGTVTESGWTTPVIYLDIDGILNDADTRAQATFDAALGSASTDLQLAALLIQNTQPLIDAVNAIFAWRIIGDGANALDSKYTELVDTNGTDTDMDDLHDLFDGYYSSSNNRYEGTIEGLNLNPNICISSMEFKAIKFGSITDLNSSTAVTNKWVAYIPTTTEIRTQIASLSDDLSQLNTTVNQQTPEWIRLQASKGFLDNVTWTMVSEAEYTSATNKVDLGSAALPTTEYVASTNTSGYRYGYYYKRTESGVNYWYRCDYPISTGFANILADRVSFGVTNNLSGNDEVKGSLISMSVDGIEMTGQKIVLNGDAIANAIAGKSLNINNKTYLNSDGSVYMCVPGINLNGLTSSLINSALSSTSAPCSTRFNTDGSGQLCGGNILWTAAGAMYLKSVYIGDPGSTWTIKTANSLPAIYSKDTSGGTNNNQELYITPQYLRSCNATTSSNPNKDDWRISRDGSAIFAGGRAQFLANGDFNVGGDGTTQTTSGVTDGRIHFDAGTGTLQISGQNVTIDGTVQSAITAGIAGSQQFASIVANAVAGEVNITGTLNTDDVSMGNGACFFKGTNEAHNPAVLGGHSYGAGTRGAGHLAKGNIWWDADGNLSIGGQLRLKGTSLEWGGSVQQFELLETDFSHNAVSGENGPHYSYGALYKLPDPMEYEGREILVEVYATGDLLASILGDGTSSHMPVELNGANHGGYDCLRIPCFTIDSNNWKHKWIKWGIDACKYNSCEISHLPKFYILGEPGMYDGSQSFGSGLSQYHSVVTSPTAADRNTRDNVANDLFNLFSSFGVTSPGATTSQIEAAADAALSDALSNSATTRCNRRGGLYLIPTAHKWQQMFDYSRNIGWGTNNPVNHESDTVVLRMKCQAKKVRYSGDNDDAWYYWEIQTTDFIPFFDTTVLSMNGAGTMSDYVDGSRPYDITASEFYNTYEKAIASSLLAFDDNFNVPALPASSINGGGELTV